ncbi:phosphatase PAP2 family protein [Clostridium botulinum]|uniref:phosphatase PAP2 family protein n=1 Tax=Clostridium botulinum TaxID=1491 RepID=UPI00052C0CFF|nr:phosphatase PAP2 family protein [Clostridium botulinum]KGM95398.1 phospholipid phosphatase [Clostridium botulinum D str. CCUG 7971]KOC46313.1 phospholipid phosphatase [Clostridium botulinum]NFO97483.1 phosphatase PAP2 family protein [Clostridium botulinum]OOV51413.1 phosphatase PAP2 family protein [Clostridium botulinum D/C]OOV58604.1 phosphatase PAP2 family protein [Clostridium botulinum D/C]
MDAIKFFQSFSNPFLDIFFQIVTMFGEEIFLVGSITLIYWCINKKVGYRLAFTYLTSMILNGAIKEIFKIPRPFNKDGIKSLRTKTATGYSFPSGHTQGSSSFFTTLMLNINKIYFYIIGFILIILIAISRLYLGVHTLMDVSGGLILGVAWAVIANKIMSYAEHNKQYTLFLLLIPIMIGCIFCNCPDYFKAAGIGCSFILGFFIETTYINFEVRQPLNIQIIKYILGLSIALIMKILLKKFLPQNNLGEFIRYFILGLWVTVFAPIMFNKLTKK